jgi:spermidine synthase
LQFIGVSNTRSLSFVLKAAVFATGLAGIVAEYVLSTLATYLLGNAIFQWTIVMSLMLFAMGLGSRLSKSFNKNLIDVFVFVEFTLSVLCASASVLSYGLAAYTENISLVIYSISIAIGMLIGFEIPLVTRINNSYEELRTNIANVMEKDYYGALVGGLLFAFVALPYLGLTYTPIALAAVNFIVAIIFMWRFSHLFTARKAIYGAFCISAILLVGITLYAKPIIMFGEQRQYKDKIIFSKQTKFQKIVMTQWRDNYWLFINGQEQFSSFDEEKYHEPLVHPAMKLAAEHSNILILGGGDGLALREIWKHDGVEKVTLVDLDADMTTFARTHPVLTRLNKNSMADPRLLLVHMDAGKYLRDNHEKYSVVIIDLPDPDTVDLMHLYSVDFYNLIRSKLRKGGVIVTQASSPYFSPKAFLCIKKTMEAAGLSTLPFHNQVPTMGEWGWILATSATQATSEIMKKSLEGKDFSNLQTRFINKDATAAMIRFGKGLFDSEAAKDIKVNTRHKPVLMTYYAEGHWAMY